MCTSKVQIASTVKWVSCVSLVPAGRSVGSSQSQKWYRCLLLWGWFPGHQPVYTVRKRSGPIRAYWSGRWQPAADSHEHVHLSAHIGTYKTDMTHDLTITAMALMDSHQHLGNEILKDKPVPIRSGYAFYRCVYFHPLPQCDPSCPPQSIPLQLRRNLTETLSCLLRWSPEGFWNLLLNSDWGLRCAASHMFTIVYGLLLMLVGRRESESESRERERHESNKRTFIDKDPKKRTQETKMITRNQHSCSISN